MFAVSWLYYNSLHFLNNAHGECDVVMSTWCVWFITCRWGTQAIAFWVACVWCILSQMYSQRVATTHHAIRMNNTQWRRRRREGSYTTQRWSVHWLSLVGCWYWWRLPTLQTSIASFQAVDKSSTTKLNTTYVQPQQETTTLILQVSYSRLWLVLLDAWWVMKLSSTTLIWHCFSYTFDSFILLSKFQPTTYSVEARLTAE